MRRKPAHMSLDHQVRAIKAELLLRVDESAADAEWACWAELETGASLSELRQRLHPEHATTLEWLDEIAGLLILDLRLTLESPQDPDVIARRSLG
jgi:hypothetical protein